MNLLVFSCRLTTMANRSIASAAFDVVGTFAAVAAVDGVVAAAVDTSACADRSLISPTHFHNPFLHSNCNPLVLNNRFYSCAMALGNRILVAVAAVSMSTTSFCHCNPFCSSCNPNFCNDSVWANRATDFALLVNVDCTIRCCSTDSCLASHEYCDHFGKFALPRLGSVVRQNHQRFAHRMTMSPFFQKQTKPK